MRRWLAVLLLAAAARWRRSNGWSASRHRCLKSLSNWVQPTCWWACSMPVSVRLLQNLPSVGRYGQLDMERLLSLKPDLLLLWPGSVGPAQREQLNA
jgi:vitamin B12 transport system substrate-binding protein